MELAAEALRSHRFLIPMLRRLRVRDRLVLSRIGNAPRADVPASRTVPFIPVVPSVENLSAFGGMDGESADDVCFLLIDFSAHLHPDEASETSASNAVSADRGE